MANQQNYNNQGGYKRGGNSGYQQVHLHFHAAPQAQMTQQRTPQSPASAQKLAPMLSNEEFKNMFKMFLICIAAFGGGIVGSQLWFPAIAISFMSFVAFAAILSITVWRMIFGVGNISGSNAVKALPTTAMPQLTSAQARSALSAPSTRLLAPLHMGLAAPLKRLIRPLLRLPLPLKRLPRP
jgi:hypothetical protein